MSHFDHCMSSRVSYKTPSKCDVGFNPCCISQTMHSIATLSHVEIIILIDLMVALIIGYP